MTILAAGAASLSRSRSHRWIISLVTILTLQLLAGYVDSVGFLPPASPVYYSDPQVLPLQPIPVRDVIWFGNDASEQQHGFYGPNSVRGSRRDVSAARTTMTYRRVGQDSANTDPASPNPDNYQSGWGYLSGNLSSFLRFDIAVDGNNSQSSANYITLQFHGSDYDQDAIFLFWKPDALAPPLPSPPAAAGPGFQYWNNPASSWWFNSDNNILPGCFMWPAAFNGTGVCMLGSFDTEAHAASGNNDGTGGGGDGDDVGSSGLSELSLNDGSALVAPRQFIFVTIQLPRYITANRTSARLYLGGFGWAYSYANPRYRILNHPLRTVYAAYSHSGDGHFIPPTRFWTREATTDQVGEMPLPTVPAYPMWFSAGSPMANSTSGGLLIQSSTFTKPKLESLIQKIKSSIDTQVTNMLANHRSQIFGPTWTRWMEGYGNNTVTIANVSVTGLAAIPRQLYGFPGAFVDPTEAALKSANRTARDWLNMASSGAFNYDLSILAKAFSLPWSGYYHNTEIAQRLLASADFFMYLQSQSGGLTQLTTWAGAVQGGSRLPGGGGAIDGYQGAMVGEFIMTIAEQLHNTSNTALFGLLDELIEADLNGILMTRRSAWVRMLNRTLSLHYASSTSSLNRGGCGSQDAIQAVQIAASVEAAASIQDPSWPSYRLRTDDEMVLFMEQAFGDKPNVVRPANGAYASPLGTLLECAGVAGGGMDFNYGYIGTEAICLTGRVLAKSSSPSMQALAKRVHHQCQVTLESNIVFAHPRWLELSSSHSYNVVQDPQPISSSPASLQQLLTFNNTHLKQVNSGLVGVSLTTTAMISTRIEHPVKAIDYGWIGPVTLYITAVIPDSATTRMERRLIQNALMQGIWLNPAVIPNIDSRYINETVLALQRLLNDDINANDSSNGVGVPLNEQIPATAQPTLLSEHVVSTTADPLPLPFYGDLNTSLPLGLRVLDAAAYVEPIGGGVSIRYGGRNYYFHLNYRHTPYTVNGVTRVYTVSQDFVHYSMQYGSFAHENDIYTTDPETNRTARVPSGRGGFAALPLNATVNYASPSARNAAAFYGVFLFSHGPFFVVMNRGGSTTSSDGLPVFGNASYALSMSTLLKYSSLPRYFSDFIQYKQQRRILYLRDLIKNNTYQIDIDDDANHSTNATVSVVTTLSPGESLVLVAVQPTTNPSSSSSSTSSSLSSSSSSINSTQNLPSPNQSPLSSSSSPPSSSSTGPSYVNAAGASALSHTLNLNMALMTLVMCVVHR